jgi:hypothetical protein
MSIYTISKCEPIKTFAKKDGSGDGTMQKIVLRDDAGKDHKCTIFSFDEVFIGDIVDATLKGYNEKFKEYNFTIKTVTPGPRGIPNTPKEPTISVEGGKTGFETRSPEESLRIVRQSTLKVVADLFSGKGDTSDIGQYLSLAAIFTEWCVTGTATPRISKEERANLLTQFGSEEGAKVVAMNACRIPFLDLLTKEQYESLVDCPVRTFPHD